MILLTYREKKMLFVGDVVVRIFFALVLIMLEHRTHARAANNVIWHERIT